MSGPIHGAISARNLSLAMWAEDVDGLRIRLGAFVQYAVDRDEPWTTERWGMVTGFSGDLKVRVTPVRVGVVGPSDDTWYALPGNLRVLGVQP